MLTYGWGKEIGTDSLEMNPPVFQKLISYKTKKFDFSNIPKVMKLNI
jgi:hypothetical protein